MNLKIFNRKKEDAYNRKKVQQLRNGKIIKEYDSVCDIQKKKGYSKAHISECCNGTRKTAYGYVWQYKEPLFEEKELENFDNYIHDIVKEYSNAKLTKKDEILTQRIIIKQEEKINRLKDTIAKIKDLNSMQNILNEKNFKYSLNRILEENEL